MEDRPERNSDLRAPDIFSAMNHYHILFLGLSCLLCNMFIQQLFILIGQLRLGISLSAFAGIILPIYFFTRQFPAGFRKQMCIRSPGAAATVRVLIATLLMVVLVDYVYLFSQYIFPTPERYVEGLVELKPGGVGVFVMTFLGLCVLVPLAGRALAPPRAASSFR